MLHDRKSWKPSSQGVGLDDARDKNSRSEIQSISFAIKPEATSPVTGLPNLDKCFHFGAAFQLSGQKEKRDLRSQHGALNLPTANSLFRFLGCEIVTDRRQESAAETRAERQNPLFECFFDMDVAKFLQ